MGDYATSARSIADANVLLSASLKELSAEWMVNVEKNKMWTMVSRMTSGSGFWKIQNKVRGIIGVWNIWNETLEKGIENQAKFSKSMANLENMKKNVAKPTQLRNKLGQYTGDMGYDPKMLKKSEDFKSRIGAYENVHGKKKGEQKLMEKLASELDVQNKIITKMSKKIEWQVKLDDLGWKDRQMARLREAKSGIWKFIGKIRENFTKVLSGAVKGILFFTIVGTLLILFLRSAVKMYKKLDGGKTVENLMSFLGHTKKLLTGVFHLLQGMFEGDLIKVLSVMWKEIIPAVWGMLTKGLAVLVRFLGIGFISLVAGFALAVSEVWEQAKEWFDSKTDYKSKWKSYKEQSRFFAAKPSDGMATGGIVGQKILVGERGPELVNLPLGSRVFSNSQSRRMGQNIHVHVNGRVGASDTEIRDIAQKVAREIGLQMNRTAPTVGRF